MLGLLMKLQFIHGVKGVHTFITQPIMLVGFLEVVVMDEAGYWNLKTSFHKLLLNCLRVRFGKLPNSKYFTWIFWEWLLDVTFELIIFHHESLNRQFFHFGVVLE